jgi:L-fucose isomerase-like protein
VQHLVLPCHWTQRSTIVADMIKSHGCAGRSIVFTDTKKDANELTASLSENCGAMALHGDIPQVGTPYKSAHFHKILHFFPQIHKFHKSVHVHKLQNCSMLP